MKKIAILLFTVLVTIIFTGCTKVPGNKAISFTDLKWEFREAGTDRWMPASVPGSVHMDLLENGVIGEPYYRNNEQKYQWIGEKNWEYRTRFICSESDLEFRNSELIFEGLDTFGEVKLNGRTILESNNFFRTWRSDTGKLLKEGENELTVLFKSAHTMTEEAVNHSPYFDKTTGKKEPIDRYSLVRKPAYHYGWDWGT